MGGYAEELGMRASGSLDHKTDNLHKQEESLDDQVVTSGGDEESTKGMKTRPLEVGERSDQDGQDEKSEVRSS